MQLGVGWPHSVFLAGWPHYPGGVIDGPEADGAAPILRQVRLEYGLTQPGDMISPADMAINVFLRGQFYGTEDAEREAVTIPQGERADGFEIVNLLPLNHDVETEAALVESHLFQCVAVGSRALIRWEDRPADADFSAYRLYWDEGDGGDVDHLLATLTRREQREYLTAALDAGTYVFLLKYVDRWGNESVTEAPQSVTLTPPPAAPAITIDAYSETTKALTLTFDTTDELRVWANYVWGVGQKARLWWDLPFDRKAPGVNSWTSRSLWRGLWVIGATRHLHYGVESIPATTRFRLVEFAGALSRIVDFGKPIHPRAVQKAGGKIDVEWTWKGTGGNVYPAGCELQLKMNDNAATAVVVDSVAGLNQTLVDMTARTAAHATTGIVGGALSFDGVDDNVNLGTVINSVTGSGQDFTIAFWAKPPTPVSDVLRYMFATGTQGSGPCLTAFYYSAANKKIDIVIRTATRQVFDSAVNNSAVGAWAHIVLRRSGTTIDYWLNGTQRATNTNADNSSSLATAYAARIGRNAATDSGYGAASIDDFRVFSDDITDANIATLYNGGAGTAAAIGGETYWYKMNDSANTPTVVDSGSGATNATFVSANDPVITSSHTASGRVNAALTFDGVDDRISLGTTLDAFLAAGLDFSLAFWIKGAAAVGATKYVCGHSFSSGNKINVSVGTTGILSASLTLGANVVSWASAAAFMDSTWRHVVLTRSGTTLAVYRDGVSAGAPSSGSATHADNGQSLARTQFPVGCLATAVSTFSGYYPCTIDDFRFYSEALTPDQVAILYNGGAGLEEGQDGADVFCEIEYAKDGGAWTQAALATADDETYEFSGDNGSDYAFRLRGKYVSESGLEDAGDWTETVEASADATPPVGDHAIEVEAVV